MKNHKWIPEKRGNSFFKWTHYCARCYCRKGRMAVIGFRSRPVWKRREMNVPLTVRPDCVPMEEKP